MMVEKYSQSNTETGQISLSQRRPLVCHVKCLGASSTTRISDYLELSPRRKQLGFRVGYCTTQQLMRPVVNIADSGCKGWSFLVIE